MRQLQFAWLDMAWHTGQYDGKGVEAFEEKILSEFRLLPHIQGTATSPSFSHIFSGGYSAGYYSYKWAEVLDADAFEAFEEKGIFNPEVGRAFRQEILEKGGTEHPMKLYKKFRGREPKVDALLRRDGLQ
jgi:peptidyl-dipeptidase Dcp